MGTPRVLSLTQQDVKKIRALACGPEKPSYKKIAQRFDCDPHTISAIVRNLIPKWREPQ